MSRRRRRAGTVPRWLAQAVTVWVLWLVLTRVFGVGHTAAALAAGAAWGLLAGWRVRGRVERTLRRLVRRAFWRFGIDITLRGRR